MKELGKDQFRILTWNCRRATRNSTAWDYVREMAPDVVLLQEVGGIPSIIEEEFDVLFRLSLGKTGNPQRFGCAVMVRGTFQQELSLLSQYDWVNEEIKRFSGNIVACEVLLNNGVPLKIVDVYSPAWPVDLSCHADVDVSPVSLSQQSREVWVGDLLFEALSFTGLSPEDSWVVGGDFNLSETFDQWKGGPYGNREYLDRMEALGLSDCLRHIKGALTPTFKNPRGGKVIHQMDHLFVTKALKDGLLFCDTGDSGRVFGQSLSDHLPIIADFTI